jgi:hypothetical protein
MVDIPVTEQGTEGAQDGFQPANIHIVGVTQGAIDIKTKGADAGKIKGHEIEE